MAITGRLKMPPLLTKSQYRNIVSSALMVHCMGHGTSHLERNSENRLYYVGTVTDITEREAEDVIFKENYFQKL
jgi:hypothetical protein